MAVHTISLAGALLILIVAFVLIFVIGFWGLLLLILVGLLLWYAFGPGTRSSIVVR
jgi:predicted membrane metal-binding protein